MRITMISIGDELLDGRTADTNSKTVGERLATVGLRLDRTEIVPDDVAQIVQALERAGDLVVLSGGLGPTVDDMTRSAVAKWAEVELETNEASLQSIKARFEKSQYTFSENNAKQAMFPVGASVIQNPYGTAPAFRIEAKNKIVFSFPGVPREFAPLSEAIESELGADGTHVERWTFHGTGESALENALAKLHTYDVVVGFRARFPYVELKLASASKDDLERARRYVFENLPPGCFFVDAESSFELRLGELLKANGATITTAESCTAGGIAAAITDIAGSSSWFERGFITYSNAAKHELIGVKTETLAKFGAVSSQVVAQMALGAQREANAEFALSVSGIAGPGGGTETKPVGTVYFGLATPDGVYFERKWFRHNDRIRIRQATIAHAVVMANKYLEHWYSDHDSGLSGPFSQDEVTAIEGVK